MRFAPRVSVRSRLSVAFLLVIVLSWTFSILVMQYYQSHDPRNLQNEIRMRDQMKLIQQAGLEKKMRELMPPRPQPGLPPPFYQAIPVQALASLVLSLLAGWWLSLRFTKGLGSLADGARAFHERSFGHRIPVIGNDEFSDVAATMNEMAEQVGEQISILEQDARRRQQVLADVAHELRSPVTTMEAMAAALRDGVASTPERRTEALTYIAESATRMRRLVNDLLEVARLDLRETSLDLIPVDLRAFAEDAVELRIPLAEQEGLRLRPVEDGSPVVVEADAIRLSQALDNLLNNAISYAGEGAEIFVKITSDPPGFVVEDNGAGIAAKHLPFIFDPFYRADAARTPGDNHSGLGLRIARGLAEAHGGSLRLESEEGRGTRAIFALPSASSAGRPAEPVPAKKG